jgi:hypothetical protein
MNKITPFRLLVLRQMVAEKGALPPGGYPTAGRDAARWWGAVRWLRENGYCAPHVSGGRSVHATDAGRELSRTAELPLVES